MSSAVVAPGSRLDSLPSGEPKFTIGWHVAKWIEEGDPKTSFRGFKQPNGARSGERFRLTPGQLRFLLWWYAVDEEGRWLYNHGVRRLAKGSGKSPFAAIMALAEFCGPARPDERRPDLERHGGWSAKQVDMPLVQIAATAESQTANTMRMVRAFAPKGSPLAEAYNIDVGKTQYYRLPEGTLQVITSSATAAEGAEGSFTVADESEHWKPSNGGVELASTIEDNLAKSGSRMLETSNAWVPGQDSVAEATFDAWVAQEEGMLKDETAILYDARMAPLDADLSDPDSLDAALRWVYEDCWWVMDKIHAIKRRIWSPKSRPDESRRKYLNQPTAAEDAWVTQGEWDPLADASKVVADKEDIVLFFDGSKSRDATALLACRLSDGHVFVPFGEATWEPKPRSGQTVDAGDVDRVVMKTFDTYNPVAFFADVREWESFALTEWPNRYKDKLVVWSAPNARPPQAVAWDMRSHQLEFAKAVEACHAEIVEKKFTHDGSSVVRRHVANARRSPYRDAISIDKESPDSPRKIDAAVCVVGVRMLYRLVLASGKYRKRSGKAAFY